MRDFGLADFVTWMAVVFFVSVVIFLAMRWLLCWYWKINRIVQLLESIDKRLTGVQVEDDDRK
jgi:hypothetical protein